MNLIKQERIRLRPHHLICNTYIIIDDDLQRGENFDRTIKTVREIMTSHEDTLIDIVEGADDICAVCPECIDARCENPQGDESAVRKWDMRILQGLGLSYGDARDVKVIQDIIEKNAPFEFCRSRCPWRSICNVFKN